MLEIGRIGKAHGIKGQVVVSLVTNRIERLDSGSVLHTDDRELVVRDARPLKDKFVVTFEGIGDRNAAEDLRGSMLRAPAVDDPDELWVHELIGQPVTDTAGVDRGLVEAVQQNPASDLLVLDSGALVPVRFVVESTDDGLVVDVPSGLFDL